MAREELKWQNISARAVFLEHRKPVTLPPGRFRPATRPDRTGSLALMIIGIVVVAAFAASAEGRPPTAAITAT